MIQKIAKEGNCIIVGRGADFILKDDKKAFHVFIHADMEHRVKRVQRHDQVSGEEDFTVISQVALASILGTIKGYGITIQFIPNYLITYCKNFIMALPLQLIIVGPLARLIFRSIFLKKERKQTTNFSIPTTVLANSL